MARARINWTTPATADLRAINDGLTRERAPLFAIRTRAETRLRAKLLEDFPRGARPLKDDTRVLRVRQTPYLIRYRIVGDEVQALRAHHEREDWLLAT